MGTRGAEAAPRIVHQPLMEARQGQPLELQATVTDPLSPVVEVKVYYRQAGAAGYQQEFFSGAGYAYSARLPGQEVQSGGVEYYLEARNQAGEISTSPVLNPAQMPYRVAVREPAAGPAVRLIAPGNESVLKPEEAVLVIGFDAPGSRVDVNRLVLWVDGKEATAQAQLSETLISYVFPESTPAGRHSFQIRVRSLEGGETLSPLWSVILETKSGKVPVPVPPKGWLFSGQAGTEVQSSTLLQKPEDTGLLAQPEGWLGRCQVGFAGKEGQSYATGNLFLTSEEKPGRQPVDRVRLEYGDPGMKIFLGDLYPVFSELSVNSPFLRGGELSLISGEPGKAFSQLDLVGGMTRAPVNGRELDQNGTFEQWLLGTRWQVHFLPGTGISLQYDTVNDYSNSITTPGGAEPAGNHVISGGGSVKLPFAKSFSNSLYGEYAYSYFDGMQNLLGVTLGNAFRAGMRWEWEGRNYARLEYKSAGSNFVSLANPWLIGDWKGWLGDAQVSLLGDALILSVDGNSGQDNLSGQKSFTYVDAAGVSVTAGTTRTDHMSGRVNFRAAYWFPTLSLGYSWTAQKDDSRPGSRIDNQTGVLNLGAGLQIPAGLNQWLVNATVSQSHYQDRAAEKLSPNMDSLSCLASVMWLSGQEGSLAGGLGWTRNQSDGSGFSGLPAGEPRTQSTDYWLANLHALWKALPGILDLGAGWDLVAGRDDASRVDNTLSTVSGTGTYFFNSGHSLSLTLSEISYADRAATAKSYGEFVADLRYGIRF